MRRRTKRRALLLVAAVAVIAGIVWFTSGNGQKLPIKISYTKVEQKDICSGVTATGTIEPVTKVEVGTQVSGIISNVYVDYNSIVKKGDVIAELDRTNLISELSSSENNMKSAQVEYEYQKKNLERTTTLYEKGLVSADDFDTANLAFQKAKNSYETSKFNVQKARTNLGYATITSPIDGVVLSKAIEEGQTVASSYNTPTLFTIAADLTDMRLIADIDEADIGNVKVGQRCVYTVDAFPNDEFEGFVTQVRQEPTTTSNVVTYEVVISAANPDLKLKPGLTANVTIYTLEEKDVIAVSNKALRFAPNATLLGEEYSIRDCEGKEKLWTLNDKTFVAHSVKTGTTNGSLTEIIEGMPAGSEVVSEVSVTTKSTSQGPTERSPFAPGPRNNKNKK
ncbi:MAG: efflux RND transporter periplasmic adaptor subunit [Bacteroidaceae bacterium]|nr:efflux RND transporter periplasmic adaptor subunit [Bacteroidaceae bacterium]